MLKLNFSELSAVLRFYPVYFKKLKKLSVVSSVLPHNIKYIILNSGDITKRYSVDAQNLIPAKFATLEVLLMGK